MNHSFRNNMSVADQTVHPDAKAKQKKHAV